MASARNEAPKAPREYKHADETCVFVLFHLPVLVLVLAPLVLTTRLL